MLHISKYFFFFLIVKDSSISDKVTSCAVLLIGSNWRRTDIYILARDGGEGCINIHTTINRTAALMSSLVDFPPAV